MCAYPYAPYHQFYYDQPPPNPYGGYRYGFAQYPHAAAPADSSVLAATQQCYKRANEYLVRALEIEENGQGEY